MYGGTAASTIERFGARIGDKVEVVLSAEGSQGGHHRREIVLKGTLMGPYGPAAEPSLTIKLQNGYNFSMDPEGISSMKVLERVGTDPQARQRAAEDPSLPLVALIGTGGTIASYVDHRTGAVCPVRSADDLLYLLPELGSICRLRVTMPMSKLSEDMTSSDWTVMACEVVSAFGAGARGVVIAHGTDTLAYSAAALSFVLRDLPGPVVLTGSQRSSDRPSSDSFQNLLHSVMLAAGSDLGEVCVLMHASVSDGTSAVHRGSRVRKMHTSRRDAFRSVGSEPIGTVTDGGVDLTAPYKRADTNTEVRLHGKFSDDAILIHAQMTLDGPLLEAISRKRRALVLAGTGLGHVSSSLVPAIEGLISKGIHVIITSSCINGRVNLRVYSTGRDMLRAGVIEAIDMTPETALVKTMWCLGTLGPDALSLDRFRELFTSDISGEIGDRSILSAFPGAFYPLDEEDQDP
ncbi:MAG: Glu-tRNA(Gln) amidotransferase subunit GatD [Candidatus Thermoplasmatota archaeon]|jgi:glutamyl-tRNA(Gln) amidotransferase subunit D|nr:Glu-tRNA(Gln) amidotransferase subunit GatD [Candidatus Thermoplasmatota archaeon]